MISFDIVFPAIQPAGKPLMVKTYPGQHPGFYCGIQTNEEGLDRAVTSTPFPLTDSLKSVSLFDSIQWELRVIDMTGRTDPKSFPHSRSL